MKQGLNVTLTNTISMTPQLQQAIKLLQMSTLDLQQEIQQMLDGNVMLEIETTEQENEYDENYFASEIIDKKIANELQTSEGSQTDIPDELPLDVGWDDIYEYNEYESYQATNDSIETEIFHTQSLTLNDHLLSQLHLSSFSDRDYAIAIGIIDSINLEGYLMYRIEDIFHGLKNQLPDLEFEEVQMVLHHIQHFDPSGVGANDLGDCLRLQLEQLPESTPFRVDAISLVTRYLDLLANHDQAKLLRKLNITEDELTEIILLIRSLTPKPGEKIEQSKSEYVIPDVYVCKRAGKWQVALNPDIAPKLRVNPFYSAMIKKSDNSDNNQFMKNHLTEAKWFIKSLHSRNDTLLRVARCIVEKQTNFLEHGSIAMRPMVLRDIAEELDLHESTISRVTTQKYMHTPNGIVEFKYFFSSHVSTEDGGECSSIAIRALIKELIQNENVTKPLSDSKIAEFLKEKGINVARRTIAKYREAMFIPSSSQRKRLL